MIFRGLHNKKSGELEFTPNLTIDKESLLFNGSLYNYFQLMKTHNIINKSHTSAEVFLRLLSSKGFNALNLMNADYSLAYLKGNKLFLLRDLLGTKPLYYESDGEVFRFSDEWFKECRELPPGVLLEYELKSNELKLHEQSRFETKKFIKSFEKSVEEFTKELIRSVSSRVYNLIHFAIFDNESPEVGIIKKICEDLECDAAIIAGVFDKACEEASKDGLKVIINSYGLRKIMSNDLSLDLLEEYELSKKHDVEIRYPFLDNKLIQTMFRIKPGFRKQVLKAVFDELK